MLTAAIVQAAGPAFAGGEPYIPALSVIAECWCIIGTFITSYRRAYHYYLYDPRAAIDDSGVL